MNPFRFVDSETGCSPDHNPLPAANALTSPSFPPHLLLLIPSFRYIHFVDSDAGSPPDRPFNLTTYENFLSDRDLLIAQPAITKVKKAKEEVDRKCFFLK